MHGMARYITKGGVLEIRSVFRGGGWLGSRILSGELRFSKGAYQRRGCDASHVKRSVMESGVYCGLLATKL